MTHTHSKKKVPLIIRKNSFFVPVKVDKSISKVMAVTDRATGPHSSPGYVKEQSNDEYRRGEEERLKEEKDKGNLGMEVEDSAGATSSTEAVFGLRKPVSQKTCCFRGRWSHQSHP